MARGRGGQAGAGLFMFFNYNIILNYSCLPGFPSQWIIRAVLLLLLLSRFSRV